MPDTNLPFDPTRLKFGVGQPVPRQEDPKLLQGQGRYTDDLALPGQLYAYVVRSPYAHAVLNGVDVSEALAAPGVKAVITAADLTEYGDMTCAMPLKNADGSPLRTTHRPALARDKLRFVGDPVAVVVAETKAQAKDAGELV
ncbi:MAG: xanthine dehydrogenase family protein molybdopterin-binding subunit, partial [Roseococcus sp.]